jgi:hypothetical protein
MLSDSQRFKGHRTEAVDIERTKERFGVNLAQVHSRVRWGLSMNPNSIERKYRC